MKNLKAVVVASVCAVSFAVNAVAVEAAPEADAQKVTAGEAEALKEEDSGWFSAGFDVDFVSAYVFRNAVFCDEMVLQPCVWVDLTLFDFLTVGGNVWQNWNLTDRWSRDGIPQEMNETDYNLHIGANAWESDDGDYSLYFELGHDFFTYRYDYDNENEITLRAEFNNPFVGVYGKYCQAYIPVSACHFEVGLKQDWNVGELAESENDCLNRLTVGFDWNVNFASGRFFSNYVWSQVPGAYDPETGEYELENVADGIGGTTIKINLAYAVCDHFTVGLFGAFTSVLSASARDAVSYVGYGGSYKDLVWGGLQAKLDF